MADEVLTLGIDIDTDKAVKHMMTFERQMKRKMDNITNAVGKLGSKNAQVLGKAIDLSSDWMTETDKLILSQKREYQELIKLGDQIDRVTNKVSNLEGEEKKNAEAQIQRLQKQGKAQAAALAKGLGRQGAFVKLTGEIDKALTKGIEAATPALNSFFGKDLRGTIEGTMSLVGKGLTKSLEWGARRAALKEVLDQAMPGGGGAAAGAAGGAAAGAAGGAAAGAAAGKAMKEVGGLVGKLGPMLQMLSKLGPVVSTLSTVLMSVVKVLIDAEAQAKEFNNEILQSASTAEFLAQSGGDANKAFAHLESTMKGIRDAAFSLENMEWGITAEEHKQVLNVLTQEGVAIGHLVNQADVAGKSIGSFVSELSHVSVAYARAFGLPLQEINQMQAEMMTDMGMSLESTQLAFAQMTRSATGSGIAANKFFQIIRGVSQDLSLYNVRMEQSVKLLKMLGKVMNPRDAAKFMQFATQGLKGMSQDDRMKVALLAGGKGNKIVAKDLENKRSNLQRDIGQAIGMQADEVAKRLSDPKSAKALWEEVGRKAPGKLGALKGSSINLKIDETASKKGVYGQAFAMENMGVGGSLDMMVAALSKFGGGSSLMEGAGSLGLTKMAENLGVNTEQLRGLMALEVAVQQEKEAIIASGGELAEKIKRGEAGTQDIIDSMSKEEQQALKDAVDPQLSLAKKQGQLTQSLLTKLGILVDFTINQMYSALAGIWDALPGDRSSQIAQGELERKLMKSSNEELRKIAAGGHKTPELLKQALMGSQAMKGVKTGLAGEEAWKAQAFVDKLQGNLKNVGTADAATVPDRLFRTEEKGKTPADYWKKQIELATQARDAAVSQKDFAYKAVRKGTDWHDGSKVENALKRAGVNEGTQSTATDFNIAGGDPEKMKQIFKSQGMDGKAQQVFFQSLLGDMSLDKLGETAEEAATIQAVTQKATMDTASNTAPLKDHDTISVKFSKAGLRKVGTTMEESVLKSVRTALVEYYLYSNDADFTPEKLRDLLKDEKMNSEEFAKQLGEGAQLGSVEGGPSALWKSFAPTAKKKGDPADPQPARAAGGVVTGVGGGLATVRAAAGEGLTSIGRGEVIVPRGGTIARAGGGSSTRVEISVKRGFEQFIEAKVVEGIQKFRKAERVS